LQNNKIDFRQTSSLIWQITFHLLHARQVSDGKTSASRLAAFFSISPAGIFFQPHMRIDETMLIRLLDQIGNVRDGRAATSAVRAFLSPAGRFFEIPLAENQESAGGDIAARLSLPKPARHGAQPKMR
jgi:hypothetical protein